MSARTKAILEALFVTCLWSSSWIFIKFGLKNLPPLTFAGLRYSLAFAFLLPLIGRDERSLLRSLTRLQWLELIGLGIVMIYFTQGAQFLGLRYFPPIFPALLLNMTPILVALISSFVLKERTQPLQWVGVLIALVGASIYLGPKLGADISISIFLLIPILGTLANACASVMGRAINRREHLPPKVVTIVCQFVGGTLLLVTGFAFETPPTLDTKSWLIVLWLASVNTAFAFTLWNKSLRVLSSVESSVINNTMLIQIALLAVVFLDETLSTQDVLGLLVAAAGSLLVQLKKLPTP